MDGRSAVRIALVALLVLVAGGAASCDWFRDRTSETRAVTTGDGTTGAEVTEAPAATEAVEPTAPAEPTTPPPPPPPPPAPAGPTLGERNAATSWAYLRNMYQKGGWWYVVVDYIQVVGPEETIHFVNQNPKLRTFPLSKTAKLQLLKNPGEPVYRNVTPAVFKAFQSKPGLEAVEVQPKNGYVVRLTQWWSP